MLVFVLKESEIGFVKDNVCENVEFCVVFIVMLEFVVLDDDCI